MASVQRRQEDMVFNYLVRTGLISFTNASHLTTPTPPSRRPSRPLSLLARGNAATALENSIQMRQYFNPGSKQISLAPRARDVNLSRYFHASAPVPSERSYNIAPRVDAYSCNGHNSSFRFMIRCTHHPTALFHFSASPLSFRFSRTQQICHTLPQPPLRAARAREAVPVPV